MRRLFKTEDIFKSVITFGFVFNISFNSAPLLSTGRLTLLLMFVLYGRGIFTFILQFSRKNILFVTAILSQLFLSLFWIAVNGTEDLNMLSRIFWFMTYSIFGAFLYMRMCKFCLSLAMSYYLVAILIQTVFVFCSVYIPEFRFWVIDNLAVGGNIDFTKDARFSGLSNGGGATLALQLGLGAVSTLILFTQSSNVYFRCFLLLAALVITLGTVFVGRTGLYISLLTIFGFIFLFSRSLLFPLIITVTMFFSYSSMSFITLGQSIQSQDLELDRTFEWAFDLFLFGESQSANALKDDLSDMKEITSTELMLGSGRITNSDGTNYCRHDAGYFHALYSMGLPIATLFYSSLFWTFWQMLSPVRGTLKSLGLGLILLVFILEIKEPFIFKYTLPFFVLNYTYLTRLKFVGKTYK